MKQIIISIHPFVFKQKINVFDGENCIESLETTIDKIEEKCKKLCNDYDIEKINIFGKNFHRDKIKSNLERQLGIKIEAIS